VAAVGELGCVVSADRSARRASVAVSNGCVFSSTAAFAAGEPSPPAASILTAERCSERARSSPHPRKATHAGLRQKVSDSSFLNPHDGQRVIW